MKNKRKNTGKFAVHSRISKLTVVVVYLLDSLMNMLAKEHLFRLKLDQQKHLSVDRPQFKNWREF